MVDPAPSAPVADQSAAEPTPTGQPASPESAQPSSESPAFDMDAWVRGRAFGGSASNPDGVVPTAELLSAPSGESAPSGDVSPDGSAAGADGAGQPQPGGRRSKAAAENLETIEGLRAKVAELESSIPERVAEAQRHADDARAEADRLRQQTEQAEAHVLELIGDPDEYRRLLATPDHELSNEDYNRRETWKANRAIYRPLETRLRSEADADARAFVDGVRRQWGARVLEVADKRGLDRAFIADPKNHDLDALLEHACAVTEARVRGEYAERLSQAERDRDAARTEALSGHRAPVVGTATGQGAGFDIDSWIRQKAGVA